MKLVRWRAPDGTTKVGLHGGDHLSEFPFPTMAELLQHRGAGIRRVTDDAVSSGGRVDPGDVRLLVPIDGRTEVWSAGVIYQHSRTARAEESGFEKVYLDVYDADRPSCSSSPLPGGCSPTAIPEACARTAPSRCANRNWRSP